MELLVIGADGLLGSNVAATAREGTVGTYHTERPSLDVPLEQFDVRETDRFRELLAEYEPDAVVNCAAMTDVDGCETDPTEAAGVNAGAPGEIATVCTETGTRFVHVSTDYVFDGTAERPYTESAETGPRQVYGETKLAGEQAVLSAAPDALVPRLSFVYGVHRSTGDLTGFPAWVRDRLEAGEPTPLFTDQHVTPSRAGTVAEMVHDLLAMGASGLVHLACRSCVTPYAFGEAVRRRLGVPDTLLEEGSLTDVDRPATRPAYTCLDVSRAEDLLGEQAPTLDADLSAVSESLDG